MTIVMPLALAAVNPVSVDWSTKRIIRQGDVTFIPVGGLDYIEKNYGKDSYYAKRIETLDDGIIQRGEATGHDHRLANETDENKTGRRGFLKRVAGALFVVSAGTLGAKVIQSGNPGEVEGVDLHRPVDLEPAVTYQVAIAREFDYGADAASFVRD